MHYPAKIFFFLTLSFSLSFSMCLSSFAYESWHLVTSENKAFAIEVPSDFDITEKRSGVNGYAVYTAEGERSRISVIEGCQLNDAGQYDDYVKKHIKEMKAKGFIKSGISEKKGDGWSGKVIDFRFGSKKVYMSTLIALSRSGNVVYLVNINSLDPESSLYENDACRAFESFSINLRYARHQQELKNANNLGFALGYYGPICFIFIFVFSVFGLLIFLLKRS